MSEIVCLSSTIAGADDAANSEAVTAPEAASDQFCGRTLVTIDALQGLIRGVEGLPVDVRLMDARVYPDHRVVLAPQKRRSRGSMNVRGFRDKYRRLYPGLDFVVQAHGRTRLDNIRRR